MPSMGVLRFYTGPPGGLIIFVIRRCEASGKTSEQDYSTFACLRVRYHLGLQRQGPGVQLAYSSRGARYSDVGPDGRVG